MNMRKAFKETINMAHERNMPFEGRVPDTGLMHLIDMEGRITEEFSEGKLGRWLGWAQACVVISGVATLEEMKALNMGWME